MSGDTSDFVNVRDQREGNNGRAANALPLIADIDKTRCIPVRFDSRKVFKADSKSSTPHLFKNIYFVLKSVDSKLFESIPNRQCI